MWPQHHGRGCPHATTPAAQHGGLGDGHRRGPGGDHPRRRHNHAIRREVERGRGGGGRQPPRRPTAAAAQSTAAVVVAQPAARTREGAKPEIREGEEERCPHGGWGRGGGGGGSPPRRDTASAGAARAIAMFASERSDLWRGREEETGGGFFLFEDCPNCAETKDDEVGLRLMWRACRRGEQLRIVRVNLIYTFTSASRIVVFNVCVP